MEAPRPCQREPAMPQAISAAGRHPTPRVEHRRGARRTPPRDRIRSAPKQLATLPSRTCPPASQRLVPKSRPTETQAHRVALTVATLGLGALSIWLAWLGHAAGSSGYAHTFRLAPWPVVACLTIAACGLRLAAPRAGKAATSTGVQFAPSVLGPIVVALLVAYVPTLDLEFLDPEDWYHLILVRQWERLGWSSAANTAWSYLSGHPGMFIRSLHLGVWAAEDGLFQGWAPGYRIFHIAFHGTTAILLAQLAGRLGLSRAAALVAALVFALGPLSRPLVRDPTGLPELTLGVLYLSALLLWLPGARRTSMAARWAILLVLVFTRDLAFTLPLVVGALAVGLDLDDAVAPTRPIGARLRTTAYAVAPTLVVPALQGSLAFGELLLDPTSGRPRPGHPWGEFGLFADGLHVGRVAAAFLRDLPRNLLLPVWDKDPEARLAPWVVVAATLWLSTALVAGRRHRGVAAAALIWVVAPMGMIFPFTSWEGPESGHLLYLSSAGFALLVASLWASIDPGWARVVSTFGVAAALLASVAFHLERAAPERRESDRAASVNAWIDAIERSEPAPRSVLLVAGTEPGVDRWKRALLARFARHHAWRHRYLIVKAATWLTTGTGEQYLPLPTVAGFDASGDVLRWHPTHPEAPTGLSTAETPPPGCAALRIAGETWPLCAVEPAASFDSLRGVLLSM